MQTSTPMNQVVYKGLGHAFMTIIKTEGPRALYKGFLPSLLTLCTGPVYTTSFEISKLFYLENLTFLPYPYVSTHVLGGLTASIIANLVATPIDNITGRRMVNRTSNTSAINVGKKLFREEKVRGFYRGYLIGLLSYLPASGF
eukprot:UN23377